MSRISPVLAEDLTILTEHPVVREAFAGKNALVTGATGFLGSLLVRTLLALRGKAGPAGRTAALVRNCQKAMGLFADHDRLPDGLLIIEQDLLSRDFVPRVQDVLEEQQCHPQIIIHCASITKSAEMVAHPAETIDLSVNGTKHMLDLAVREGAEQFLYLSSMEVYGDMSAFGGRPAAEDMLGSIDPLAVRSCYPISKRLCENLCAAYYKEYGLVTKIARLAQTFGPGILPEENRVFAQFARSAISGTDIVLHTKGLSETNCCYTRDMILGLGYILAHGNAAEAYNVVNENTHCTISEAAHLVAEKVSGEIKVVCEITDQDRGYAKDVKLTLSGEKLRGLGWQPQVNIEEMYKRMIEDMRYQSAASVKKEEGK